MPEADMMDYNGSQGGAGRRGWHDGSRTRASGTVIRSIDRQTWYRLVRRGSCNFARRVASLPADEDLTRSRCASYLVDGTNI